MIQPLRLLQLIFLYRPCAACGMLMITMKPNDFVNDTIPSSICTVSVCLEEIIFSVEFVNEIYFLKVCSLLSLAQSIYILVLCDTQVFFFSASPQFAEITHQSSPHPQKNAMTAEKVG